MTAPHPGSVAPRTGKARRHALGPAEVSGFREQGFVGPFDLIERQHALDLARFVLSRGRRVGDWLRRRAPHDDRHVDVRRLRDLCVLGALLDRVEDLLGPDLVLWRTRLFVKGPGARAFPFHQDDAYYRLRNSRTSRHDGDERHLGLSAWIALTDADTSNGCVELIPGTHLETWAHVPTAWRFGMAADPGEVARRRREPLIMKAGQFFLFDNHVVHGSGANTSLGPRVGFAARYTMPHVWIGAGEERWWARPSAFLVRGSHPSRTTRNADPRR